MHELNSFDIDRLHANLKSNMCVTTQAISESALKRLLSCRLIMAGPNVKQDTPINRTIVCLHAAPLPECGCVVWAVMRFIQSRMEQPLPLL